MPLSFTDINECQQNACGSSSCTNMMGSYQCQCQGGYNYQGYGYGCQGKYKQFESKITFIENKITKKSLFSAKLFTGYNVII